MTHEQERELDDDQVEEPISSDTVQPLLPGINFIVPVEIFRSPIVVSGMAFSRIVDTHDADQRLRDASSSARQVGETAAADALQILSVMASYHFVSDDRTEPFRPMMVMGGRRSLIPNDLLLDQIKALSEICSEIGHLALRARVSDVCWFRNRRDVEAGLLAVSSYVACVEAVLNGEAEFDFDEKNPASVPACEFLRRATIIARAMGWKRNEFDVLRDLISRVTQKTVDDRDALHFVHISRINFDNDIWDNNKNAESAELLANDDQTRSDFFTQRALWDHAARAYHEAKDADNEHRCRIASAETYVGNADTRTDSAMVQASFLSNAIEALRPIPGTAERRRQLHDRLSRVQSNIGEEMSSISHEQDITGLVVSAESYVSGKSLPDAIRACLTCARPPDPDALRKEALEGAGLMSSIIPVTVTDHQGRTRFKAPGMSLNGESNEDQAKFMMSRHDQYRRQLVVVGKINPIRRVIMGEHNLSLGALLPIMEASVFVPPGHAFIFAKGALRFFAGDDIEAAHLLLPQLENSLRHLLTLSGVETNRIDPDGVQEEAMLSRILESFREPLLKIIPLPIIHEIDLLFNFRGGPSIRNELAHGKMADSDFWGAEVAYSIWIVLRMVILPTLKNWNDLSVAISENGGCT